MHYKVARYLIFVARTPLHKLCAPALRAIMIFSIISLSQASEVADVRR